MSGPIVRTGATPKFWENWDRIFGDKKKAGKSGETAASKKTAAAKGKKKK